MVAFTLLGAALTALALTLLLMGGYLAALLLCTRRRRTPDPLILALGTLVMTTGEAVAVGLVLGVVGALRIELGLGIETALVFGLYRAVLRWTAHGRDPFAPARKILRRIWGRCCQYPVLALVVVHAAGTELLRGLLRPPLSWDSLMYHLFLAATWLQNGGFEIVAARHPTSFYQFMPGNGSVWLWWWMAPSHSELYVNAAFLPQWLLLGLAAGAFARQLGAERHWPIASFLVVLIPSVVRFLATQYVDITLGGLLIAGSVFAVRWLREAAWGDAVLLAVAGGVAGGTKVLGLPFAGALGLVTLGLIRDRWRTRTAQLVLMVVIASGLAGVFYARNLAVGGGPFAYACAKQDETLAETGIGRFPAAASPVATLPDLLESRRLVQAFLGVTKPTAAEIGVGPQALLLLPLVFLIPFVFKRRHQRVGWITFVQVGAQLFVWSTVTYAANVHVFANVRYLTGAVGLLFAAGVALGERRLPPSWLRGVAVILAIQNLLMLNPRMPYGVRVVLAWSLLGVVVLALAPRLRQWLCRRRRPVGVVLALCCLLAVPPWARFRVRDRERSFRQDYIAHLSGTRLFAAGWGWLDEHAGSDTVAVSHAPENFFVYPAMGPFLERRALYVNVNEEDHANPLLYEDCKTRTDRSPTTWLRNLEERDVRWLHVGRYPELDFPVEDAWARSRPDRFHLRFQDRTNRIYELVP